MRRLQGVAELVRTRSKCNSWQLYNQPVMLSNRKVHCSHCPPGSYSSSRSLAKCVAELRLLPEVYWAAPRCCCESPSGVCISINTERSQGSPHAEGSRSRPAPAEMAPSLWVLPRNAGGGGEGRSEDLKDRGVGAGWFQRIKRKAAGRETSYRGNSILASRFPPAWEWRTARCRDPERRVAARRGAGEPQRGVAEDAPAHGPGPPAWPCCTNPSAAGQTQPAPCDPGARGQLPLPAPLRRRAVPLANGAARASHENLLLVDSRNDRVVSVLENPVMAGKTPNRGFLLWTGPACHAARGAASPAMLQPKALST